jgi:hypothetical protein
LRVVEMMRSENRREETTEFVVWERIVGRHWRTELKNNRENYFHWILKEKKKGRNKKKNRRRYR